MRVLIAPDKFKGTLSAAAAAAAIARGWRRARPDDTLTLLPISDGGDGFGLVLSARLSARPRRVRTVDAAHRPRFATWWWHARSRTAVIEAAQVIGLARLPHGKFHPFALDTFGLGAVLRAARRARVREIILGIGGSATNDGGFGLARALGWRFRDQDGRAIVAWTDLPRLRTIKPPKTGLAARLTVAVDVRNPLLGRRGATRVYGPQKGLRGDDFKSAERCLRRLAQVFCQQFGGRFATMPGAGAAGGLGFGLLAFAGAELQPGFDLVADHAALDRHLERADLVVTGEGAIDATTIMGKGCGELARRCRRRSVPCVGLAGTVVQSAAARRWFAPLAGLTDLTTPAAAMRHPQRWLARLAAQTAANLDCKLPPRR
jgi:glycerate kinase